MNITEERKRNMLIVLVLLLSVFIFFQFSGPSNDSSVLVRLTSKDSPRQMETAEVLDTSLLSSETPRFLNEKRNIFQFKGNGNASMESPAQSSGWMKIQPSQDTKPVVPDVHYLGFYIEKDNPSVKLAAISNSGRIYVGKVGDTLGGKYQVLQIEKLFLLLRLVNEQKVARLPLGKQNGVFIDSGTDDDEDDEEEE